MYLDGGIVRFCFFGYVVFVFLEDINVIIDLVVV